MTMPLKRPCPVCDGRAGARLHTQAFTLPEGHPLTDGYDVVACDACGMVFADTAVTQADYDAYYAKLSKYEDNATSTGGGGSPFDLERLKETAACIARHLPAKTARIADIGCGNGGLLLQLKELGYSDLCGIDPSPGCVRNMRAQGLHAFAGTLHRMPEEAGAFDAVALSHVLEHVRDVRSSLADCTRGLRPGGLLYVEVPDASRYGEFLGAPFQEFNTEHINHFSVASLANLLRAAGFAPFEAGQKLLPTPGLPYPAAYAVCKKEPPANGWTRDEALRPSIEAYIRDSAAFMARLCEQLEDIRRRHPELVVWGTGQLLLKLLGETALKDTRIVAFVDGNPINQGKRLKGIPIIAPAQAQDFPQPVLVASLLNADSICASARSLGLTNTLLTLAR